MFDSSTQLFKKHFARGLYVVNTGAVGEQTAAKYLRHKGWRILERNYRSRFGEIDIIAANKQYILFVEVKTRSGKMMDRPAAWVTTAKQHKIIKTAALYLQYCELDLQPRFDVIEVYMRSTTDCAVLRLEHLENAFEVGDGGFALF